MDLQYSTFLPLGKKAATESGFQVSSDWALVRYLLSYGPARNFGVSISIKTFGWSIVTTSWLLNREKFIKG